MSDTQPKKSDLDVRVASAVVMVAVAGTALWQAAYAEMMFPEVLWPDFTPDHLRAALDDFAARERRYGGR